MQMRWGYLFCRNFGWGGDTRPIDGVVSFLFLRVGLSDGVLEAGEGRRRRGMYSVEKRK